MVPTQGINPSGDKLPQIALLVTHRCENWHLFGNYPTFDGAQSPDCLSAHDQVFKPIRESLGITIKVLYLPHCLLLMKGRKLWPVYFLFLLLYGSVLIYNDHRKGPAHVGIRGCYALLDWVLGFCGLPPAVHFRPNFLEVAKVDNWCLLFHTRQAKLSL